LNENDNVIQYIYIYCWDRTGKEYMNAI